MDSLTGRRRKNKNEEEEELSPSKTCNTSSIPEFMPDLYKAMSGKKFRASQPESEEERQLMKSLPSDTEATILHIRSQFPNQLFQHRLPSIVLYSQLRAILANQFIIDTQLSKLAKENKILTFSTFTSSNYLIVLLEDFIAIKRDGVFQRFVSQVIASSTTHQAHNDSNSASVSTTSTNSNSSLLVKNAIKKLNLQGIQNNEQNDFEVGRSLEHSKYFSKESLLKRWKFEEDEIRQLVNGGYLGIQEGGMYCISLPGAGEFTKQYTIGKKSVINAIRRARYGEILQSELEQRPMKKAAPLGVLYHIYDLIGAGDVEKLETTSGPLLRVRKKT